MATGEEASTLGPRTAAQQHRPKAEDAPSLSWARCPSPQGHTGPALAGWPDHTVHHCLLLGSGGGPPGVEGISLSLAGRAVGSEEGRSFWYRLLPAVPWVGGTPSGRGGGGIVTEGWCLALDSCPWRLWALLLLCAEAAVMCRGPALCSSQSSGCEGFSPHPRLWMWKWGL